MNRKKMILLIEFLLKSDDYCSSEKCAEILQISAASFKQNLIQVNNQVSKQGAEIIGKSGHGNGYRIYVFDSKKFENYLNSELSKQQESEIDFSIKAVRVNYILKYLLQLNDWVKCKVLIDELFISPSQLTKDLKTVRNYLAKYDINLIDKPHYGMRISGDEFHIRLCLARVLNQEIDEMELINTADDQKDESNRLIKSLERIVVERCKNFNYLLSGLTLNNLVVHLFVAYRRVKNDQKINLTDEMRDELRADTEFALAASIIKTMQDEFSIEFDDDEVYYVIIHLSSKRIAAASNVNESVSNLVDEMLAEIKQQHNIDLLNNFNLKMMLSIHIVPLLDRIKYKTKLYNPLLMEIRSNLIVAYDLALCCMKVLNEKYNCSVSEDEVGFIALHLKVALDQTVTKKDILLVCATGQGSAQLLKYNFEERFAPEINSIETCDVLQVNIMDVSKFDAIFTMVPLNIQSGDKKIPPIFQIDSFFNNKDVDNVKKQLNLDIGFSNTSQYFKSKLFFTEITAIDKEDLIKKICNEIDMVVELPPRFEEEVLKREALAQTHFGGIVAFPHPNQVMEIETFISVTILKHPIEWGTGKVQIVLLSSFEKGFIHKNKKVFDVITKIISEKKYSEMLIAQPNYNTLLKIIRGTD